MCTISKDALLSSLVRKGRSDDFSGKVVVTVRPGLSERQDHLLFDLDGSPLIGKSGKQASVRVQVRSTPKCCACMYTFHSRMYMYATLCMPT